MRLYNNIPFIHWILLGRNSRKIKLPEKQRTSKANKPSKLNKLDGERSTRPRRGDASEDSEDDVNISRPTRSENRVEERRVRKQAETPVFASRLVTKKRKILLSDDEETVEPEDKAPSPPREVQKSRYPVGSTSTSTTSSHAVLQSKPTKEVPLTLADIINDQIKRGNQAPRKLISIGQ